MDRRDGALRRHLRGELGARVNGADPTVHLDYAVSALLVGFALERLVPAPRTRALGTVIGWVRGVERWTQARVPPLSRRPKLWTELTLVAAALAVRMAALVMVAALSRV